MKIFSHIVDELYDFAYIRAFRPFDDSHRHEVRAEVRTQVLPVFNSVPTPPISPIPTVPLIPEVPEAFSDITDASVWDEQERTVYVVDTDVSLHVHPVQDFDGVVTKLPYGTSLLGIVSSGRWMNVEYEGATGWVLRDTVSEAFTAVHPQFVHSGKYDAENAETIKLRNVIEDTFSTDTLDLDLQDVEYVTYKLLRKGRHIAWTSERPRIAGRWQKLLKGISGIFITVTPKTDSVMETIREDGTGHVAYVEAVFPDQSILVSEIGLTETGQYSEQTLDKEVWRELRPIFIEVG